MLRKLGIENEMNDEITNDNQSVSTTEWSADVDDILVRERIMLIVDRDGYQERRGEHYGSGHWQ